MLTDQDKKKLKELREFAEKPENIFHPDVIMKRGGPETVVREHTIHLGELKVLFSIDATGMDDGAPKQRHLSLSGKGAASMLEIVGVEMGITPPFVHNGPMFNQSALHLIGVY